MTAASSSVPPGLWRQVMAAAASDQSPWLILPKRPSESSDHEVVSYAQLFQRAEQLGSGLRDLGAHRGDRIAIVADNTAEAALMLLGTLASGFVAVPVPPRTLGMPMARWCARLRDVCADCSPRFLVGREERLPPAELLPEVEALSVEQLPTGERENRVANDVFAGDVALIQYTSGTTGRPRGVELTHENIFHNVVAIGDAIGVTAGDVGLTWLPLFHDMGLIGSLLAATYLRIPLVLMAPSQFLMRPESWLWAVSRFRVTFCAAPNSAYHACATKIPERKLRGLDLSSWRSAFNGSELVQASTLDAFCGRYGAYGFRAAAMYPVYGLAENTLATAFPPRGTVAKVDWIERHRMTREGRAVPCDRDSGNGARGVVSVGSALEGQELRIVDRDGTQPLPERVVGGVQVRGRCVMRGYHGTAGASTATLTCDGWLDTGDTGYMHDGELYVVGRSKDVIHRGGLKYDAGDICSAATSLPGVRAGHVAAFGVPDSETGTDAVVIMVETTIQGAPERIQLRAAIASALTQLLSMPADEIVLVAPGVIPQTTSGKVRNAEARAIYLELRADSSRPTRLRAPAAERKASTPDLTP
jgi:acyl-CoA synthetase (AMP-forming)/AMP-acid ligase II